MDWVDLSLLHANTLVLLLLLWMLVHVGTYSILRKTKSQTLKRWRQASCDSTLCAIIISTFKEEDQER